MSVQPVVAGENLSATLSELLKPAQEIGESLLVSATYDGDSRLAVLKFYDQKAGRTWLWKDNTGHRPYCFTRLPRDELGEIERRKDVIGIVEEERLDLLNDQNTKLRKIVTTDPLAIGGGNDSIRDRIKAWEADIKYYENYAYDRGLQMGTYYKVSQDKVLPVKHAMPEGVVRSLEEITRRNQKDFGPYLEEWAELLGEPIADFKRIAMDIEVANEAGRLPDPEHPDQPIIAISFFNDREKAVYLLRQGKDSSEFDENRYTVSIFDDEAKLLGAAMAKMMAYPFLVTFNGDSFDLRYLKHRAEKLGLREDENPIQLERVAANLKHGVHIDLYQFFRNRSIQVYAFANKYTEHTLDAIADSILGKSKLEFEGEIGDLPLNKLAEYCLNDSQLAYELTSMSDSLVMKLLLVIARIGRMPMNDVSRLGVSNWIRSMLFYEHRKMRALIPRPDELAEKGGASSQSIIKGKKYKGGLVIEPKPGVHFDVSVMDFASLVFDESILVRKRQTGQVYKTKIGEFVDSRLPPGTEFAAKEIGPTWDVLSFDYDNQRASWKTITAVIRHPNQPEVLELVTESGRRARITGGHSVIALDHEGNKRMVRASELKAGDYLIALSSFSAPQGDGRLDLLPYLQGLDGYEITRGRRGRGTTAILRAQQSHRRFVLPRYLKLTPEMMWGLGYWLAEGWHRSSKYRESLQIEASTDDVELARSKFATAGFKTWMAPSKTVGCSNLGIGQYSGSDGNLSASVFAKLVVLWFGNRARDKRLPDWVMQLPLQMKEALIDGYYKGDGYNPNKHGSYVVNGKYKVGSYSHVLIDNLMSLGLISGLHCFSKAHCNPESYLTWSRGAQTYRGTKRPPPELLVRAEHVRKLANTPYYGSHQRSPIRYERVNRASVEAYKPTFERFYNGNCHFEKIKRIGRVRNGLPVYDISVRDSESFFNADGLLLSNSLYPSLIKVHNLSYETVNCPHPECRKNKIPDTDSWECSRRKGITSLVIGSLRDLRVSHYKVLARDPTLTKTDRDLYNVVSQGLKVYLNAAYGSFGFESFAFYCLPVAEATAALGRDAITKTIEKAKELGIEVAYGDTDSLFLKSPSKLQIETMQRWADADLGVELDLDKVYRYVAFSSRKKNYFGVLPDGTVDIRGLTGKKSQTPDYLKETFYSALDILSRVRSPEDFEKARASIRDLLGGMIANLKGKKVPVQKLAFNVMMGKPTEKYNGTTPQHVRAAKLLEERGREIKAGEMIAYVKTKSPPYVKPVDLARVDDVDSDKYIEYAHSMFDQMLDALDFSFDEIMGATTLDFFWSS